MPPRNFWWFLPIFILTKNVVLKVLSFDVFTALIFTDYIVGKIKTDSSECKLLIPINANFDGQTFILFIFINLKIPYLSCLCDNCLWWMRPSKFGQEKTRKWPFLFLAVALPQLPPKPWNLLVYFLNQLIENNYNKTA